LLYFSATVKSLLHIQQALQIITMRWASYLQMLQVICFIQIHGSKQKGQYSVHMKRHSNMDQVIIALQRLLMAARIFSFIMLGLIRKLTVSRCLILTATQELKHLLGMRMAHLTSVIQESSSNLYTGGKLAMSTIYGGYLLAHFIGEQPDGEQVYFSYSEDG